MTLQFRERPDPAAQTINVLLYGPPKSGKTTGACSIPGGVLLMNTDLPNASLFPRSRDVEGRILEVRFEGLETLVDVTVGLQKEANGGSAKLFDSVVIDPVGEMHRQLLEEASGRAIRPARDHYGDVTVHIERFCRAMCELPINTVIVCHETPVKDELTGGFEMLPWTGTSNTALGQKLMGMVDIVGYCGAVLDDDENPTYVAQLLTAGGRRGGSRWDLGVARRLDLAEWLEHIHQPTHTTQQEVPA